MTQNGGLAMTGPVITEISGDYGDWDVRFFAVLRMTGIRMGLPRSARNDKWGVIMRSISDVAISVEGHLDCHAEFTLSGDSSVTVFPQNDIKRRAGNDTGAGVMSFMFK